MNYARTFQHTPKVSYFRHMLKCTGIPCCGVIYHVRSSAKPHGRDKSRHNMERLSQETLCKYYVQQELLLAVLIP